MTKEDIANLLYNCFDNVYCDSCRHDGEEFFCDECHRKSMNWSVSKEICNRLAETIAGKR